MQRSSRILYGDLFSDIPEPMIREEQFRLMEELKSAVHAQGLSMEYYCTYLGKSEEDLLNGMYKPAEMSIRKSLVIEEIAKAEDLSVSNKEIYNRLKNYADKNCEDIDRLIRQVLSGDDLSKLRDDLLKIKVEDFLYENSE